MGRAKAEKPPIGVALAFRVRWRILHAGQRRATEAGFGFRTLEEARTFYKAQLLSLYRRKDVASFAIILNRRRDPVWQNAIHTETIWAGD